MCLACSVALLFPRKYSSPAATVQGSSFLYVAAKTSLKLHTKTYVTAIKRFNA